MKLFYAPSSPYSAKVRMAALYLEFDITSEVVNTAEDPAVLTASNPLGKIPTLVTQEDGVIFDSRAIMQYLNRRSGGGLYPKKDEKRTQAEVMEALCDGITDSLIAIIYERRFHPPEKIHQPWIDRHWAKVMRGLDHLDGTLPKTGRKLHGGHFALAALLGYLMLRFPGQWEGGRANLAAWPDLFNKRFSSFHQIKPQG